MDVSTLFASVTSAVTSKMLVYPLDTIAIQKQTNTSRRLFQHSWSNSLKGLYRGLGISMLMTTPAVALYLCTYRQAKESFMPMLGESNINYVCSGTCAELVSSWIWTPQEVMKSKSQISTHGQRQRLFSRIYQEEGIRGFYRGYWMGLAVFVPYNAIWWSTYENVKMKIRRYTGSETAGPAIASASATLTASTCLHPFELLKTRYQFSTSLVGLRDDRRGIRYVFKNVVKETGFRGLYAGLVLRLGCSLPGSVISMAVFEFMKPDHQGMT